MPHKISSFEYQHSTNLGDEIQTIAAIHVLQKLGLELDQVVNRKSIETADKINLLVNGFFELDELKNFFQKNVTPLFSNIHIHIPVELKDSIDEAVMQQFKDYQPIGCRDRATMELFKKRNIDAFLNYCLTLTFDKRDNDIKRDKIFIVDVDNKYLPLSRALRDEENKGNLERLTHCSGNIYSHEIKMKMAQTLLEKYEKEAKLVITSRLHCALPCIAMGIPTIFFGDSQDSRLHLVEEFIPIHPYFKKKSFFRKIRKKIFWQQVNWQPDSLDIEEIKKLILKNLSDKINSQ